MNSSLILTFVALLLSIYNILSPTEKRYVKYKITWEKIILAIPLFMFLCIQGYHNYRGEKEPEYYWSIGIIVYIIFLISSAFKIFKSKKINKTSDFIKDSIRNYELKEYDLVILDMKEQAEFFKEENNKEMKIFLQQICNDRVFIKELANNNPKISVELILDNKLLSVYEKKEFIREFYMELLNKKDIFLFEQIKKMNDNQITFSDKYNVELFTYNIEEEDFLLYPFIRDNKLFRNAMLCNPIRNVANNYLKNQRLKSVDEENHFNVYLPERDLWESTIFICINLTDWIVREGIKNRVDDPMLLYRHTDILEEMIKNIKYSNEFVEDEIYLQNNYEYYIRELMNNLSCWIEISTVEINFLCPSIYDYALKLFVYGMESLNKSSVREKIQIDILEVFLNKILEIYKENKSYGELLIETVEKELADNSYFRSVIQNFDEVSLWPEERKQEAFEKIKKMYEY